jgi:O-antigen/teichoic acid export membrane protein
MENRTPPIVAAIVPGDGDSMNRSADPTLPVNTTPAAEPDAHPLDHADAGNAALRGGALRMGSYVAGVLLSLVSVPLLVRHLGIRAFGEYAAVLSLVTIVSGLTEAGLTAIAIREYATTPPERRPALIANLLGVRLVFGLAGAALAVVFAVVAGYGSSLVEGTALAGVGMVIVLCQSLLTVPLQVELRQGWVALLELLRQFITVVLVVALVVLGAGVAPFLAVTIPAGAVALVATIAVIGGHATLRPAFHPGIWWPLVRESTPYALAIAINAMYLRLTIVVMSLIATGLETGYFATSFRVIETLIGVPALMIGAAFPILARAVRDDVQRFASAVGRIFELGVVAGAWMVVCVVITAPLAIRLIGGAAAAPAVPVLRIQGLALIATFVAVGCGYPLLAERRYREVLLANVVGLVASLTLTVALVPSFHAKGAAVATVTAELALAGASALLLARSDRGIQLPWASVPRIAVAAAIALGAGLVVPIPAVLQAALATVVYGIALVGVRRFPPELQSALALRRYSALGR